MLSGSNVVTLRHTVTLKGIDLATKQKRKTAAAPKKVEVTIAQIVKRDKAFANPDFAVRRARHKGDGTWFELIARGDGKQTALLAGFRSEREAARCKRTLLEAINKVMVPLLLPSTKRR